MPGTCSLISPRGNDGSRFFYLVLHLSVYGNLSIADAPLSGCGRNLRSSFAGAKVHQLFHLTKSFCNFFLTFFHWAEWHTLYMMCAREGLAWNRERRSPALTGLEGGEEELEAGLYLLHVGREAVFLSVHGGDEHRHVAHLEYVVGVVHAAPLADVEEVDAGVVFGAGRPALDDLADGATAVAHAVGVEGEEGCSVAHLDALELDEVGVCLYEAPSAPEATSVAYVERVVVAESAGLGCH